MCAMTHSLVRHDSFICVTWLIVLFSFNSLTNPMTSGIHLCNFSDSQFFSRFVYNYLNKLHTRPNRWCCSCVAAVQIGQTHLWMSHVTYECESCRIWTCHVWIWVMSHMNVYHITMKQCHITYERGVMSHMRQIVLQLRNSDNCTYEWVMSRMKVSLVTYECELCHVCIWVIFHVK